MAFDSTEWAWRDMTIFLDGERMGKVTKLTNKTTRETEYLYGAGDDPFDINPGNKAFPGEMEIYGTVIAKMNQAAQAKGYDDLTDVPWVLTVDYKKTATDPRQFVTLPGVRFEEFEEGGSNNDKSFKKTLPFKSLRPIRGRG